MLLSTFVELKWGGSNTPFYKEKGYKFTKNGDAFIVEINDLPNKSNIMIDVKCDKCSDVYSTTYILYKNKKLENDYCKTCLLEVLADRSRANISEIRKEFAKKGYQLISITYKNSKDQLEFTCNKHEDLGLMKVRYDTFRSGKGGCKACCKERKSQNLRLSIDKVKEGFQKKGFTLLTDEYVSTKKKMPFLCNRHQYHGYLSWNGLNQDQGGCPECQLEKGKKVYAKSVVRPSKKDNDEFKKGEKRKKEVKEKNNQAIIYIDYNIKQIFTSTNIKDAFVEKGYILLTDTVTSINDEVEFMCQKHNFDGVSKKTLKNFLHSKFPCKTCLSEHKSRQRRKDINEVKKEFEKKNCKLITKEYINNSQELEFTCNFHPEKGVMETTYNNFNKINGCKFCSYEKLSQVRSHDLTNIKMKFEEVGCILLTKKYINEKTKLHYICLNHKERRIQETTWSSFRDAKGCPHCYYDSRKGENNNLWKGGLTPFHFYFRRVIHEWKSDSRKANNYKCYLTNQRFDVVHHLYSFNKILKETFEECQLDVRPTIGDYNQKLITTFSAKGLKYRSLQETSLFCTDDQLSTKDDSNFV